MQILNYRINYSPSPSFEEMLGYEYWELHEAAFILASWPKHIFSISCDELTQRKGLSRRAFYVCGPHPEHPEFNEWKFNINDMGHDFIKTYDSLREAIKNGQLDVQTEVLHISEVYQEKITFLVPAKEVIRWAYRIGIYLPKTIQDTIGIHLINEKQEFRNERGSVAKKVKIKIIGQLLREYFPKQKESYYCKHEWMRDCCSIGIKDPYQSIRNDLRELRDPNSKKGAITKEARQNEKYILKPIPEVIRIEKSGIKEFSIGMLKIAIETAATTLLKKYSGNPLYKRMTYEQFLNVFMKNPVVTIYIEEAPEMLLEIVRSFVTQSVFDFFFWRDIAESCEKHNPLGREGLRFVF